MARDMPDQGLVDSWIDELDDDDEAPGSAPATGTQTAATATGGHGGPGMLPNGARYMSRKALEGTARGLEQGEGREAPRATWDPGVSEIIREAPQKKPRVL